VEKILDMKDELTAVESAVGDEKMVLKLCEECGELIQAANKWLGTKEKYEGLISEIDASSELMHLQEELADVLLMMCHIINITGLPSGNIVRQAKQKLKRAGRRLGIW